jgi:3-isopropylmalate dehydrogenase
MLLRHSLELEKEADALESAVSQALEAGVRTPDVAKPGERALSTREAGDAILKALA